MNNARTLLALINNLQFRLWEIMSDYRSQDDLKRAKEICSMLKEYLDMLAAVEAKEIVWRNIR